MSRKHAVFLFAGVAALVFVSRLPFLAPGYGTDNDAWRIASTARAIALTGQYKASRLPGYPVQELVCSVVWTGGPLVLNGMTAFFSALAVGFFALSLKALGYQEYLLASFALACTPVVFIHSTTSMDYLWALAGTLGSLYFVLIGKPWVAGMFLGWAVGCRITSGAMLLPLGLLLVQAGARTANIGRIIRFALGTCLVATGAFVPVVLTYGRSFLTFSDNEYPPLGVVLEKATAGVWGTLGSLALLLALGSLMVTLARSQPGTWSLTRGAKSPVTVWFIAIGLYVLAFLRLPQETGYLLPIVPFVLLALGRLLPRRVFVVVCVALIFSAWIDVDRSGTFKSPILADYARRVKEVNMTHRFIAIGNNLNRESVIVAGHWHPKIETYTAPDVSGITTYVYLLDEAQAQNYLQQGYMIYYLPHQAAYNLEMYGVDLQRYGAVELGADGQH